MQDEGWEDVTDPGEIRKVLGKPAAAGNPSGLTPSAISKAKGKIQAMNVVEQRLDRIEELYNSTLKGVGLQSFAEYLPTPRNQQFDAAAKSILPIVRSALSTGAKDSDSDRELAVWMSLIPEARAYDSVNEERIKGLREMAKSIRSETEAMLGMGRPTGGLRIVGRRPK